MDVLWTQRIPKKSTVCAWKSKISQNFKFFIAIFNVSVSEYFFDLLKHKKKVVTAIFFFLIFSAFLNHEEPIYCHTFWSQFCCHMVWFFRAICKLVLRLFLRHGGLPHLSLTWCEFLKTESHFRGKCKCVFWLATLFRLEFELFFLLENYIQSHLVFRCY